MSEQRAAEEKYDDELTVRGSFSGPMVAIVGTREPSIAASEAAFNVATKLARVGIGVVSGLAIGIDAAAHRGAIAGRGLTVAVLGHGIDAPLYPPEHQALSESIIRNGALVSPYHADALLTRPRLLARNRWIARLSRAVWVVQTGVPGGALSAAAAAKKLGIPVFTTVWKEEKWHPGSEMLLKEGAELIKIDQVVERMMALCEITPQIPQQGELFY